MEQIYFRAKAIAEILDVSPSTIKRLGENGALEVEYFGPSSPRYRLPRTEEEWQRYHRTRKKAFVLTKEKRRAKSEERAGERPEERA